MRARDFTSGKRLFDIPIEYLVILPEEQNRTEISNKEYPIEDLARNIAKEGQQEAITVRPHKNGADIFAICRGRRRRMAVDIANKKYLDKDHQIKTMQCKFEEKGITEDERIINDLSSNTHAKPHTALEFGTMFVKLRDKFGWSVKRISENTGKSRAWVENMIEIAEADPEIKKMLETGQVKPTTAKKLIHGSEQTRQTARLKADLGQKVTGKDVEKLEEEVKEKSGPDTRPLEIDIVMIIDGLLARGMKRLSEHKDFVPNTTIRIDRKDPPLVDVLGF